MIVFSLWMKSLKARWFTSLLLLLVLTLSLLSLLFFNKIQRGSKASFESTLSRTDLIAGGKTGALDLLLYNVFYIGRPTALLSFADWKWLESLSEVQWTIPLALGDSYRGFPVIGTTSQYWENFRYGHDQSLRLAKGRYFSSSAEVVLGADVCEAGPSQMGQKLILSHGGGEVSFHHHDQHPFEVVGCLEKNGTPVDRALLISLESVRDLHLSEEQDEEAHHHEHASEHGPQTSVAEVRGVGLTGVLMGLTDRRAALALQRKINEEPHRSILAVLPGMELQNLWKTVSHLENLFHFFFTFSALMGLATLLLLMVSNLYERKREIQLFRTMGASIFFVYQWFILEALLFVFLSWLLALVVTGLTLFLGSGFFERLFSIQLQWRYLEPFDLWILLLWAAGATLMALGPAIKVYKEQLQQGLTNKV